MIRHRSFLATLATAAALSITPTASSQCVGPDNLDVGACCGPAVPNLPIWTQGFQPALGVCWDACTPTTQTNLTVSWIPPQPSGCATYTSDLLVSTAAGMPLMKGTMNLDYTRTWYEINSAGQDVQVWRFLVKVDLGTNTATPPICPVPDCLPPTGTQSTAFFYGYLDYAQVCLSPAIVYQHALVLFHGCDFLIHKPGLSSAGGAYHPTRSYAIVAPHSTVQPFIPANLPFGGGGLAFEGFRGNTTTASGAISCQVEDRLTAGAIQPFAQGCLCPLSTFPAQNTLAFASGTGSCPNSAGQTNDFESLNIAFPTLPWPYMVMTSIGRWSSPAVYPGQEAAWVNEGLFRTFDVCDNVNYFEVKYGSTTEGGFPAFVFPGGPSAKRLFDMVDNWTAPVAGPHPLPLMGKVMPTDHLVYSNVQ